MKNILVTGGAGFIGSNFVRCLLDNEPDINIVNLDALTYAGSLENLNDLPFPDRHTFVHGDICDRSAVDNLMEQNEIDTIVHFAAETHVDRSIAGPGVFVQTNIVGTFTLLESAKSYWQSDKSGSDGDNKFHHVSTDEVHGDLSPSDPAWTEESPYEPNSPYAASKASSDHLVRSYDRTYNLPYTITNCSNNYGPYQFPEKLIPLVVLNAMEGRAIPVYGDGMQVRDWLFVGDHCEAILEVLRHGTIGETYNIGGNNQTTNIDLVRIICDTMDLAFPTSGHVPHRDLISYVKDRPGHDRRYALSTDKIHRELNWQPKKSIDTGMQETLEWYIHNPEWISAVRNQPQYQAWLDDNYSKRRKP